LSTEILKRGKFGEKRLAVMGTTLGAATEMELSIVARHATPFLENRGFRVERIYAGNSIWMTALDFPASSSRLGKMNLLTESGLCRAITIPGVRIVFFTQKASNPAVADF
jgi:dihydroxyacetone kinase